MSEKKSFIKEKFKDVSPGHLLYLELESVLFGLFSAIPGILGMALRNLIASLFFHKKQGFYAIQPRVVFVETGKLSVGKHFAVNSGTYINAKGTISIGDDVIIGTNVTISSGMHPIDGIESSVLSRPTIPKPIVLEDDIWIGSGAVIMPGVTLKKGTVVGANSTVTHDTEPYAVVAGSPARVLRYRGGVA